jgi:hypothetical protein
LLSVLQVAAAAPHLDVWPPDGAGASAAVVDPTRGVRKRDRMPPLPCEARRKLPWRPPDPARNRKRPGEAAAGGPDRGDLAAALEGVPHPVAGACSSSA